MTATATDGEQKEKYEEGNKRRGLKKPSREAQGIRVEMRISRSIGVYLVRRCRMPPDTSVTITRLSLTAFAETTAALPIGHRINPISMMNHHAKPSQQDDYRNTLRLLLDNSPPCQAGLLLQCGVISRAMHSKSSQWPDLKTNI